MDSTPIVLTREQRLEVNASQLELWRRRSAELKQKVEEDPTLSEELRQKFVDKWLHAMQKLTEAEIEEKALAREGGT